MPALEFDNMPLISLEISEEPGSCAGAPLPLFRMRSRACGKAVSALFLSLALTLPGSGVLAAGSVGEQIEQALAASMQQALKDEAQQQGWQGMQVQLEHELPAALPAAPCTQALQVQRTGDDPSPLARQRFALSCADSPGWKVNASSQASVFLPVVLASKVLERGQTISAADLRLEPANIGKASRGFYNRLDQVVGMSAKRRIRDGQQLNPGLLTGALLVKRGQRVRINASQDGIQASAVGEALSNGQLGEVIRVKNLASEKTIDAKVIEAGVVSSTFQ